MATYGYAHGCSGLRSRVAVNTITGDLMAVEIIEGFDTFSISQMTRRYPNSIQGSSGAMSTGRYSVGQALALNNGNAHCDIPVTARSEYYVGFDAQLTTVTSTDPFFKFTTSGGSTIGSIGAAAGGVVTSTWGNSASGVITAATWFNVQMHIVISASVGVFVLKVDGNTVINLSSLNTGSTNVGFEVLQGSNVGYLFDNVWSFNTTGSHSNGFPVGTMTVQTLYPTADGTYTDFTPNSGSNHYSRVNEAVCNDDTSYVYATNVNSKDSYTIGSLSGAISQVHGVQVSAAYEKDDTPAKTMRVFCKSSSTTSETSDLAVPAAYTSSTLVLNDDPNTSAQWTTTNVNALEVGVKVIA